MELLCFIAAISFGYVVTADNSFKSKLDYIKNHPVKYVCSDIEITDREGIITSPNYPALYSSHLSCSWHILGNVGDIVQLWFDDVDIEESCSNIPSPCCRLNWLKVGSLVNDTEKKLCGKNVMYEPVMSNNQKLWIKFHISKFVVGGRGFQLHYRIIPRIQNECKSHEFKCAVKGQCISKSLRCNRFPDCEDGTDEVDCLSFHTGCDIKEIRCGDGCIPENMRCNGIADCEDGSDEYHCSYKCLSGRSCHSLFQCYNETQQCDGKLDCSDYSDEINCGFCRGNFVRCGPNSTQCYNPVTQKCDKIFHCLNGEDEKDCEELCPGKIMCDSRRGCYPLEHRCNGVAQCEDASDEKNCVPQLCNYEHGGFLCDNRRCIQQVWTCDHTDDCGDGSDERKCLRNSVLTAAVMGSLICALLLVIAISCTCRLHALRMLEHRLTSRETPLSRLSREFFFREPPPSYAVAVQGSQHHNLYVENLHYGVPVHRGRRRGRRQRHSRNSTIPPAPPPLPPLVMPRNCALVSAGGTVPETDIVDPVGESSNSGPSVVDSPTVVVPVGSKNDCVIPLYGESQTARVKDNTNKGCSQTENDCSLIGPDSESLSLEEPISVSLEDTSDSVQNTLSDHYFCDSDSEPLIA